MNSNALRLIQSEYQSDSGESSDGPEIHISSPSSDSSWSLSSDPDINEDNESIADNESSDKTIKTKHLIKTKGELSLEDLPPIENLSISVGVEELSQLGRVVSIVDQLVIVQSFRSMPALDLDSVLFLKNGQPLGQIFDVFGPVVEPRYAVRFNDAQQISDRQIGVETAVYFAAEQHKPITSFVFAEQLRRMKGSDASWKHNNEPPEEVLEFSDDESERMHNRSKNRGKRTRSQANSRQTDQYNRYNTYRVPPNTPNTPITLNSGHSSDSPNPSNVSLNQNYFQL